MPLKKKVRKELNSLNIDCKQLRSNKDFYKALCNIQFRIYVLSMSIGNTLDPELLELYDLLDAVTITLGLKLKVSFNAPRIQAEINRRRQISSPQVNNVKGKKQRNKDTKLTNNVSITFLEWYDHVVKDAQMN